MVTRTDNRDTETYSDVRFDMKIKEISERPLNAKENNYDIQKLVDEDAVVTSLKNLLHTVGCTRLLNPEIDLDLSSFLFEPINQHTAYWIGYCLNNMIPAYEPRVVVKGVKVVGYPDEKCYDITLTLEIPTLNKVINVSTILEESAQSI